MIRERLKKLISLIEEEFLDLLQREPILLETKIRLYLKDGSFIEIRYPLDQDYSFHWQRVDQIFRINTAPDHPDIKTFPRHIHEGMVVKEDYITDFDLSAEENLRRFLLFVRKDLDKRGFLGSPENDR